MINKGAETLKGKDVQAYKSLAKYHDTKNYKKGLKTAEKILQTNPDHPETLAMKALFESAQGDDDKALDIAKNALMKSKFGSILCWHTYGTLWKNKRNWEEASKCFNQASKLDPHNLQLLREVANLSIQVRDHSGHLAARYKLLQEKPSIIHHWLSFALAYHLKGDFVGIFKTLGSIDNLTSGMELKPVQVNHLYLYRVLVYRDSGNFEGMLQQLHKNEQKILDKVKWREHMLFCTEKLGKTQDAKVQIIELLKKFPENLQYLVKYQGMVQETPQKFYQRMNQQLKSKISKIMQLRHTEEENEFKKNFAELIKPYFQKNLPSLYREIQVIYSSEEKEKWIGEVFSSFQTELSQGKYPGGQEMVSPSEYLWAMFMLSQHLARKFETMEKAYDLIKKSVEHTNTVSEIYIVKAQIEYKLHNNIEALKTINEARKTDLADRYMNNICVKYLMKCRKPDLAEDVLRMFMKDEANLYQLQNQWYIIEAGKSFLKDRKFGPGLKHLDFIQRQFLEMYGNHYDFHTYCIRKWTLSEYIELIHYNDNLYQDKKYIEAAGIAIPYLCEYNAELQNPKPHQEQAQEKEDEKAGGKKKKKNKKKQAEVEELKPIEAFRKKLDYYGKTYLESTGKQPLKEAYSYATNVVSAKYVNKQNKSENKLYFKAFSQSINVFIELKKPLLVVKALKKLIKTEQNKYDMHLYTLKCLLYLSSVAKQTKEDLVKEFVEQFIRQIMGESASIEQFHKKAIESWEKCELQQIKVKECDVILNSNDRREEYIKVYRAQLIEYMKAGPEMKANTLQMLFYVVHRLQFYGELTEEMRKQLNQVLKERTSYFSNWHEQINQLPPSTWTLWWLSDYDQQKEELDFQEKEKQEGKQQKRQGKPQANQNKESSQQSAETKHQ